MAAQTPPIDPVTVAITLASAMFGPPLAAIVGTYAVIVIGAIAGSAWSASGRPPAASRVSTLGYIALFVTLALLVTVPGAELLARYIKLDPSWVMGPLAAFIGGVGDKWPALIQWALRRRFGDSAPPPTPPATPGDPQ